MQRADEKRYQHFLSTGQEKLRLEDALQGYFDQETPAEHRKDYFEYLKIRYRSACDLLVEEHQADRVGDLIRDGLMGRRDLDDLIERSAQEDKAVSWLQLLRLREVIKKGDVIRQARQGKNEKESARLRTKFPTSSQAYSDLEKAKTLMHRCRREIYSLFPFLGGAVCTLRLTADLTCQCFGTDTDSLFYSPEWVLKQETKSHEFLLRSWLHTLLHCLLFHPMLYGHVPDAACDMAVEFIIERECWQHKNYRRFLGYLPQPGLWSSFYEKMQGRIWSPDRIVDLVPAAVLEKMTDLLCVDDHRYWERDREGKNKEEKLKKWKLLRQGAAEQAGAGRSGLGMGSFAGDRQEEIRRIQKSRHDYRSFLQKFAVPREELELDLESFDYIYYTLGMERFGNLPLLEPLEYREGHKLEELAIAIDTSGSCKADTVRRFLEESYAILDEKENFFRKMNVWIFQCDCTIQDTAHIRSRREWEEYLDQLKIQGRAGTDFRPVFRRIEKLKETGELTGLRALLYFTDGDGIFPIDPPDYETAFVFIREEPSMRRIPPWARILLAGDETLPEEL
ncbi:MAG: hypothetical protein IKE58_04765 [Blautia sp.]|nr:hypothetical protein [Blautia sp.]